MASLTDQQRQGKEGGLRHVLKGSLGTEGKCKVPLSQSVWGPLKWRPEGLSGQRAGPPTSKPCGLEHMGVGRPRGDEMLLEQEAGDLHDGTEGPFQDSLGPVTRQGTGCLNQFVPRCWGHFWAHFWLQWGRTWPIILQTKGPVAPLEHPC